MPHCFSDGHGEVDCITGHKNKNIIVKGINDNLLCDRVIYARSCFAAQGVGKSCMKNNTDGCFIGYNIPFMFFMDTTWATNPIKDNTAKVFFDTSNRVPISLIKDKTGKEADENSKKAMLKSIKRLLLKGDENSESIAQILWNNYIGQVLVGNGGARI